MMGSIVASNLTRSRDVDEVAVVDRIEKRLAAG